MEAGLCGGPRYTHRQTTPLALEAWQAETEELLKVTLKGKKGDKT